MKPIFCFVMIFLLYGCTSGSVIATSATTFGLSIGTDGGQPTSVLGYKRAEYAYVPTDRCKKDEKNCQNNSGNSADVLMEFGSSGANNSKNLYQRLAVGKSAVRNAATALFIKDGEGKVDADAAKALEAIKGVESDPENGWSDGDDVTGKK